MHPRKTANRTFWLTSNIVNDTDDTAANNCQTNDTAVSPKISLLKKGMQTFFESI